jgi:hypothetical protein
MVDLFERVDEFGRSLGATSRVASVSTYIGYFAGKRSFFTIEVQRQRLTLYFNLDPTATTPWNHEATTQLDEAKAGFKRPLRGSLEAPERPLRARGSSGDSRYRANLGTGVAVSPQVRIA